MLIIPVIDLLEGQAVHAQRGHRTQYRPIQSNLATSADPHAITKALLAYYPFAAVYIADLNAIQKKPGHHLQLILELTREYPNVQFWVDAGISNIKELAAWSGHNFNLVLGSENFHDIENFHAVTENIHQKYMLSLDFMPDGYKGPPELLKDAQLWPQDVIAMTLANVGSNAGVNIPLLSHLKLQSVTYKTKLYAAGGVRDYDDLMQLKKMHIHGALMATALHQQQISAEEISNLTNKKAR